MDYSLTVIKDFSDTNGVKRNINDVVVKTREQAAPLISAGLLAKPTDWDYETEGGMAGGPPSYPISATRDAIASDNGRILTNSTANDVLLVIKSGMAKDSHFALMQGSTGTCTITGSDGVFLIGTPNYTSNPGQIVFAIWMSPNNYSVKVA